MFFNRKILFGLVSGIFCTLFVIWIYRTLLLDKSAKYSIVVSSADSTVNRLRVAEIIKELESSDNTIEKISSINKRIDDVLIFGGVIVTLLLAISVGVYIKAESEVERHFKDNFDDIRKKVNEHATKIEEASSKAQSQLEIVAKLRTRVENDKQIAP